MHGRTTTTRKEMQARLPAVVTMESTMLSKADVIVLHALTLPIDQAIEVMMEECYVEPELVLEPAFDWWARNHGQHLKEYVLTQTYRDRAPFRHARAKRRYEDKMRTQKST